ncbi:MAG TPA: hypothetical protein VIC85_16425 [Ktedonobacterales bacterium]
MAWTKAEPVPGTVAILGSGEAAATGRRVLGMLLRELAEPRTLAVLDTPAGFQPNADRVAGKLVEFIAGRLGDLRPRAGVVRARREDLGAPMGEAALAAIAAARCVVAGPGSPSYMIRQLADTPFVAALRAAHRRGATLYFASAAAVAMGTYAIPVYEIFKVGEEPRWIPGLDVLAPLATPLAIVPHWNNSEGGAELDTSRCFLGQARFDAMRRQLPPETLVLGIDEHTACVLDFGRGHAAVLGAGGVELLRGERTVRYASGETFPLELLASLDAAGAPPDAPAPAAKPSTAGMARDVGVHGPDEMASVETALVPDPWTEPGAQSPAIPAELVDALVAIRMELRAARHFAAADHLRDALLAAGITIQDTPEGPHWEVAGRH